MMNVRKHIGIMVPTVHSYGTEVIRGILHWAQDHENWRFTLLRQEWRLGWDLPFSAQDPVQGVIGMIYDKDLEKKLQALQVPVVNVAATRLPKKFPLVHVDDLAVGKMAAEHLLDLGFRHFLFMGRSVQLREWYSYLRGAGFARRVREAGCTCHFAWQDRNGWLVSPHWQHKARLESWIRQLERPLGIMITLDLMGETMLKICKRAGLAVPQEAAVIGADNDVLVCETLEVPLSSVIVNADQIGAKAAEVLARMLHGAPPPLQPLLLPPMGAVGRASTESVACADRIIRAAIEFIRTNADRPLKVGDITRHLNCTRRALERGFRIALQRTPYEQIIRTRVERAQQLLSGTSLPIAQVGVKSGFEYPHHFSMVFKRRAGMTPKAYRKMFRT